MQHTMRKDPLIFIRRTLENAVDARDTQLVIRMSAMIDRAMIDGMRSVAPSAADEKNG